MIESNLVAGTQKLVPGKPLSDLVYGQSITDGCVDWPTTHGMLAELSAAVRARREVAQDVHQQPSQSHPGFSHV
jgi:3-deoxy-7-phosphoheptulonate synthase